MKRTLVLLLLGGCAAPSHWQLEQIASEHKQYELKRLTYTPEEKFFGMKLEFVASNDAIAAYICSQGRPFSTDKVLLKFGDQTTEATLALREGKMRSRLPDELAAWLIEHLKEGQPLTIILGATEQTFLPEEFSALFEKLRIEK